MRFCLCERCGARFKVSGTDTQTWPAPSDAEWAWCLKCTPWVSAIEAKGYPDMPVSMNKPAPEIKDAIKTIWSRKNPRHEFVECKVLEDGGKVFVRVYFQFIPKPMMPLPYEVFEYSARAGTLRPLGEKEGRRFCIPNYR